MQLYVLFLLLVKLQLQKAAYPHCIVTIYIACYTDIVLLYDFELSNAQF